MSIFQNVFQRVENLRAVPQRFRKIRRTARHDHELLKIDRCVRMRAAVQDVHHRNGKDAGFSATEITEEGQIFCRTRGMRDASETRATRSPRDFFCWAIRPARSDVVDLRLVAGVPAFDGGRDSSFTFATALVTPLPP